MNNHSNESKKQSTNFTNFDIVEVGPRRSGQVGLFSHKFIEKNSLIGCYSGKIVVVEVDESTNRLKNCSFEHRQIAQIYKHGCNIIGIVTIDGFFGVDFINHSCEPNFDL